MSTNYLHNLSSKQLIAILKHVQCGHAHLSKILSKSEYEELLSVGSLSNNQMSRLESDKQEKIGNVSVVVNTILTSCFGAWLGFNGFNQTSIMSVYGLLIIFAAASLGLLSGTLTYIYTHRQEKFALKNQELRNVERVVIEIIINKRKNKIELLQHKIQCILANMGLINDDPEHINQGRLFSLLKQLQPQKDNYFFNLLNKCARSIKRSVAKLEFDRSHPNREDSFNSADFLVQNSLTNASYIKVLTKTEMISPHKIPKVNKWLRKNLVAVSVGLLPTFLGSFASMFVFLNGFPAFFEGINQDLGSYVRQLLHFKNFGLLIAFGLSLYFAYSHIHSNYKSYRRAKQLEITENHLAEMTNQMLQLTSQLNNWYKIVYQLELLEEISNYSKPLQVEKPKLVLKQV